MSVSPPRADARCLGWRLAGWAFAGIARWPGWLMRWLGLGLEGVFRFALRGRWQVARINLAACFPGEAALAHQARLRAHQTSLALAVLELLRGWFAPGRPLAGLAHVEGLHHLHEAAARGQGVVLLTGHLMHTELALRFLVEAGSGPIHSVVRRYDRHPCFEALLDGARRRRIGPTVGKFDTRGMVRALREGGRLAYSADQDFRTNQVFVPFFRVPAATLASVPQLVKAGRACVRFFAMVRDAEGHYTVRVWDPGLDALLDAPEAFARRYMAVLQQAVEAAPDQYLWVHRRFKTRPPGEPPLYP